MQNFCPECNRLTASVLADPEILEEPHLDEETGEITVTIRVSLHCGVCGHRFVNLSFEAEGMVSQDDLSEHAAEEGHEIQLNYGDPTLAANGVDYELTLTVNVQCSCPEDEHELDTVECERTLTEEEIEEALA